MQEACQAVFADAEHFEELDAYTPSADTAQKLADTGITIGTVYEAQDASGTQLGYVIRPRPPKAMAEILCCMWESVWMVRSMIFLF